MLKLFEMPLGLDCSDNEDGWIEVEVGKGIVLYIVFLSYYDGNLLNPLFVGEQDVVWNWHLT